MLKYSIASQRFAEQGRLKFATNFVHGFQDALFISYMFEQSLYETELVVTPLKSVEDSDLFREYELKNWEFNPRIYKILGVATVFNLVALLIFSQTSVLTAKGCDSPLVGSVCSVLDTVYVGSMLFGTSREYVDVAYEKTDLGDADITFVDVSGETPPLSYPEGYFELANPNEYQAMLDQANNPASRIDMSGFPSGITTTTPLIGNSLIDTKPNIPKANPNVIDGDLPTIDDRTGLPDTPISKPRNPGFGKIRTPRTTPVTPKPTPDPNTTAVKPKTDPPVKVDPTDPPTSFVGCDSRRTSDRLPNLVVVRLAASGGALDRASRRAAIDLDPEEKLKPLGDLVVS